MVIAGCGGFGFTMALQYRKETATLRQLVKALDYLYCELECRATTLPQACRMAGSVCNGCVKQLFLSLAEQMESQVAPDAACCVRNALNSVDGVPRRTGYAFYSLADSLGIFHLDGQLRGLNGVQLQCSKELEELEANRSQRIRSYQTLGLCAGAALAILFI